MVFSDQTLDTFEAYDRESYRAIIGHFAYWDDIEIHFRGTTHRIGGNGFCGCARSTLLKILGRRARSLGVQTKYQTEIAPDDPAILDADLVVAADGINSRLREAFAEQFQPSVDLRPNFFSWMGSTRPFDAFTFFFRETEHGIFIAHCYQYEPGRSTWIIEADPATYKRAGLDRIDEQVGAVRRRHLRRRAQGPPADHQPIDLAKLPHHPLRALDRRQRRADRRRQGDRAFLHRLRHQAGDGGCDRALRGVQGDWRQRRHGAALAQFEKQRREEVEKTQHSADVSLVWFEHVKRFWDMDPTRFAPGLMTRSKAITYDNLALRAPEFVKEVDRLVARDVRALGFGQHRAAAGADVPAVPAAQHDAGEPRRGVADVPIFGAGRHAGDWHLVHYGSRAIGGAGLMFTEMTDVSEEARISLGCAGMYNDATRRRGSASSISCTRSRRPSSACSSAMPAARAPPS